MKNLFYLALLFSAFIVISCDQDPCKDVVCGAEGTCIEGSCDCNFGYEKDSADLCNTAWATKFVKANVPSQDTCYGNNNGVFLYNTTVTMDDATTLSTSNLFGYTASNIIKMDVTSSTDISINYTDVAGRVFTGTGSKVGNVLTLDVIVDFPTAGVSNDTCVTTLTY
ncbi:MAG: hypothetical protein ACRBFS_17590 [Aureispira sp.]